MGHWQWHWRDVCRMKGIRQGRGGGGGGGGKRWRSPGLLWNRRRERERQQEWLAWERLVRRIVCVWWW